MLEPAMLHKEAVINGLKKHIYDDEMIYYSGWNGYTIPNIPDEFESSDYRYAILDKEKVIGYFCYHYDMYSRTLSSFGLYSFDRGNPIIGRDVFREIRRVIKEYQPHRMEWRMISGNPVEKHYDRFCKKYNGKKFILTDVIKDKYGNYHNDVIYEVIFSKRITNFERIKQMNIRELSQLLGCINNDWRESTRTIDGHNILDSFDDIEEWLESEVDEDD